MGNQVTGRQPTIWVFWLACGVAAAAGAAPIVLAGASGRVNAVIVPLLVAAASYAGCALLRTQGKTMSTGLYFLAGLSTLYGILSMLALPLRLAIVGICPPAPALCAAGLEQPLTPAENTGIGLAVGLGILAIFLGFFGLATLYRRLNAGMPARPKARSILPFTPASTPEPAHSPPVRRIPPVVHSLTSEPEAATAAPPAAAGAEPELVGSQPAPELEAHEPQLELPAPAPELELPAHVEAAQPADAAVQPAPAPRPRRNRSPRKDPTTPDTSAT